MAFRGVTMRGRGLVHGISGSADEVIKLMPPLTITDEEIDHGIQLLTGAMEAVCG